LQVIDEENLAEKMPKNYKAAYIENDTFFLVGGFEAKEGVSSKKAFTFKKGVIQEVMEMYKARQFFPLIYENKLQQIYAIGGYNTQEGAMDSVERYDLGKKEWEPIANLNNRRLNCGACLVGNNHIFVFGGRNEETFYDTVERLNIELNLWNLLKIQLPSKICNTFAFTFNEENIILMGGLKRYSGHQRSFAADSKRKNLPEYEIEKNVYLYNQRKETWFMLKPLPSNHKLCNIVHDNQGRFTCFLLDSKQPMPYALKYDLREICPTLDRYWLDDYSKQIQERKKNKGTEDLFAQ